MTASQGAVFLSYASEDAQAAQRICAKLRAAGVEAWFDQSELQGGDAWDAEYSLDALPKHENLLLGSCRCCLE
jgi:hypothetical protein